ncbi:MAG: S1 RNA-binding domain-containing protein [Acidobacteria bacterium]|nr:S1 RNA-binding domain-containing protein [Acidobacteriota bacterium]
MDSAIIGRIVQETAISESAVTTTISLFEKGATGPFIVHYRKEATGGLDENKVRLIQERMIHYREVWDQRAALLKLLSEQGKLTDELRNKIESCFTKAELDDLHHQFRPRKKTRAAEAAEKGLEPLAEYFWNQEADAWSLEEHINVFVDPAKGVPTQEAALQGSVDIIAEWIWANFEYRKALRNMLWTEGALVSTVVPAKVGQKTKYTMYYERREPVTQIPSHRVLAIRRGCKEGILISSIEGDNAKAVDFLLSSVIKDKESIFAPILEIAVRDCYARILRPLIETEVRTQLKERADREAIKVFQENLANLLLSPPAGPITVMGVDWGKGDECSAAVVNETGAFLEGAKIRFTPVPARPQPKAPEAKPTDPSPAAVDQTPATEVAAEPAIETQPQPSEETAEAPAPDATPEPFTDNLQAVAAEPQEPAVEIPAAEPAESVQQPDLNPAPVGPAETAAEQPDAVARPETQDAEPAPVAESSIIAEAPTAEPLDAPAEAAPRPGSEIEEAKRILRELITKYKVQAISIGTGTGARELETALRQIIADEKLGDILIAAVNDAGIAIYSSSRIAREEFPDWSASARCAVSLARRLQDPLSELVKIDPKLIGVGQYQHDVDQKELHRGLLQTVQYCVNKVGVNLNASGESLLRYVSGLNDKLARKLVAHRNTQGSFSSRASIISAVNMDKTTYEQCAAFLRIPGAENVLDRTAVHPESYPIVEKMASALSISVNDLVGNKDHISKLKLEDFVAEGIGIPTLNDIREELLRPGRDPRKTFKIPKFRADVREMSDLTPGMTLEGTVTNVTNFGAFVDIGVRQDGLVHLSQMSNRFIRDPREAVKVGDVVQVKVISVEPETKRIGLSMKALLPASQRRRKKQQRYSSKSPHAGRRPEGAATEAAGTDPASSSAASERALSPGAHSKSGRARDGKHRYRNKGPRRFENAEEEQQRKREPVPKLPEPTLQEKIAILQSKFRRIN